MFTDIVNSTKLKDLMPGETSAKRQNNFRDRIKVPHAHIIFSCVKQRDGVVVEGTGDGFLIAFTDAEDGVLCGLEIQEQLKAANIETAEGPLEVRIGLHTGQATPTASGYTASAADKAARVQSKSEPGQVFLSAETHQLVLNKIQNVANYSAGHHELKGLGSFELFYAMRPGTVRPSKSCFPPSEVQSASTLDKPQPRFEELLVLVVPAAIVIALSFGISGPWDVWLLRLYAFFLGCYSIYILGYEYHFFSELHRLKSKPLDMFLVACGFISIYQFSKMAADLSICIIYLSTFPLFIIMWEIYTMWRGYECFFNNSSVPIKVRVGLWREYCYWLLLDGVLLLGIGVFWLNLEYIQSIAGDKSVRYLIAFSGFLVGAVNIHRYNVKVRKIMTKSRSDDATL